MSSSPSASEPIVSVHDLGKCHRIYDRPQDRLKQALLRGRRKYYREFWALRGISFDVHRGESLGIVGRNGSGKSTLLQLIAGTMAPTEGEVEVHGRVAAMLELGTGFNPEFTGRENVFLQGAMLGIGRREMEARFDAIAAFADIGAFIDQPVKTYSSGMTARLAFAVAFAVEPDVLIVDELLAVGDLAFQARCLSRLRQLRDRGLTMLFVSHSPDAIRSICGKGLFLIDGTARFFGDAERATDLYLAYVREQANRDALAAEGMAAAPDASAPSAALRYGTGHVRVQAVQILNGDGEPCRAFEYNDTVVVEVTVRSHIEVSDLSLSFLVRDMTGVDLMGTTTFDERVPLPPLGKDGILTVRFSFTNTLRPGNFGVSVAVNRVSRRDYTDSLLFDQIDGGAAFTVLAHPERPVHYKFHQPVVIRYERVSGGIRADVVEVQQAAGRRRPSA